MGKSKSSNFNSSSFNKSRNKNSRSNKGSKIVGIILVD